MSVGTDYLEALLEQLGGANEKGLKYLLIAGELEPMFESDENWSELCRFAAAIDERHGISSRFEEQFRSGVSPKGAMQDNYVLAALAASRMSLARSEPLMAYAAFNKHAYPGYARDGLAEMGCMRVLHWGGWDVAAAEPETGMTPLHFLASTRHLPGSIPRGVLWLLERGADPAARNANGDTALAYLCGISVWSDAQLCSLVFLLLAGADPTEPANDGTTALFHLKSRDESQPIPLRTRTIQALEEDIKRSNGYFTRKLKLTLEEKWRSVMSLARAASAG